MNSAEDINQNRIRCEIMSQYYEELADESYKQTLTLLRLHRIMGTSFLTVIMMFLLLKTL
jgi:hypothetical protein